MTPKPISLCHANIHLDKCFILQHPDFDDLKIDNGDFNEAMRTTSTAKRRFTKSGWVQRGRRLILECLTAGVIVMRVYIEVDKIVSLQGIEAAFVLRQEFKDQYYIQICAFAQLQTELDIFQQENSCSRLSIS